MKKGDYEQRSYCIVFPCLINKILQFYHFSSSVYVRNVYFRTATPDKISGKNPTYSYSLFEYIYYIEPGENHYSRFWVGFVIPFFSSVGSYYQV